MRVRSKKEHPSAAVWGVMWKVRSKKSPPFADVHAVSGGCRRPSAAVFEVLSKKSTALEPYVGFCIPSCSRLSGFDEPSAAVSGLLTEKSTSGAVYEGQVEKRTPLCSRLGGDVEGPVEKEPPFADVHAVSGGCRRPLCSRFQGFVEEEHPSGAVCGVLHTLCSR